MYTSGFAFMSHSKYTSLPSAMLDGFKLAPKLNLTMGASARLVSRSFDYCFFKRPLQLYYHISKLKWIVCETSYSFLKHHRRKTKYTESSISLTLPRRQGRIVSKMRDKLFVFYGLLGISTPWIKYHEIGWWTVYCMK